MLVWRLLVLGLVFVCSAAVLIGNRIPGMGFSLITNQNMFITHWWETEVACTYFPKCFRVGLPLAIEGVEAFLSTIGQWFTGGIFVYEIKGSQGISWADFSPGFFQTVAESVVILLFLLPILPVVMGMGRRFMGAVMLLLIIFGALSGWGFETIVTRSFFRFHDPAVIGSIFLMIFWLQRDTQNKPSWKGAIALTLLLQLNAEFLGFIMGTSWFIYRFLSQESLHKTGRLIFQYCGIGLASVLLGVGILGIHYWLSPTPLQFTGGHDSIIDLYQIYGGPNQSGNGAWDFVIRYGDLAWPTMLTAALAGLINGRCPPNPRWLLATVAVSVSFCFCLVPAYYISGLTFEFGTQILPLVVLMAPLCYGIAAHVGYGFITAATRILGLPLKPLVPRKMLDSISLANLSTRSPPPHSTK